MTGVLGVGWSIRKARRDRKGIQAVREEGTDGQEKLYQAETKGCQHRAQPVSGPELPASVADVVQDSV